MQKRVGGIAKAAHQQASQAPLANVFICLALYPLEIKEPVYTTTTKALHKGLYVKATRRNLAMLNGS